MEQLVSIGLILIVLGVLTVFIGLFLQDSSDRAKSDVNIRGGAVVFIGPIPVVIGTDRESALAVAVLAIVLIALAYLFLRR